MPDTRPDEGESLITAEMRRWIGVESPPIVYQVTKDWIRKWCEAIEDFNPLFYDDDYARQHRWGGMIAPPTFIAAVDPQESGRYRAPLTYSFPRGAHAGDAFEFFKPVRPGDIIVSTTKIFDFYEKIGRNGRMLFTVREAIVRNQDGQLVARMLGSNVSYGKPVAAEPTRAGQV